MIYEFSPTQDLHGYDKPWAPGAGINLLIPPTSPGVTTTNGIVWDVKEDGRIKVSGGPATASSTFYYIRNNDKGPVLNGNYKYRIFPFYPYGTISLGLYIADSWRTTNPNTLASVTVENDAPVEQAWFQISSGASADYAFAPMLYDASETPNAWSPYANICMPEGYNIWDPTQDKMIPVYSGYVDAGANKLYLHPVYEEYDGEELVGPWMSSLDEYTEDGTPTAGAFVIDFGGELTEYTITDFMLQTLLDSLGIRRFITSGATLLNSLMDQAQGRVRSEEELLNLSMPIHVIAIRKELPTNLVIKKPVSDVLPVLPGKTNI